MALTGELNSLMQNIDGEINGMRGAKGETGNGIASIVLNPDYTLTITFTDGSSYTTAPIRGAKGEDGHSPVVTATKSEGVTTIKVDGETVATILDGVNGQDGHSPIITTTKSGKVTTILSDGSAIGTVEDGADGNDYVLTQADKAEIAGMVDVPSEIDDTAGAGDTDKTWSADKITDELAGAGTVQDVQVNGTSVVNQGIASITITEVQTVQVTGATPVITANQNTRYVCGEVATLDFTPSASGICDVIFTSGSTATVLTLPNTVILPSWFDATTLEANTTYEISISDGVYGAVMIWQ